MRAWLFTWFLRVPRGHALQADASVGGMEPTVPLLVLWHTNIQIAIEGVLGVCHPEAVEAIG